MNHIFEQVQSLQDANESLANFHEKVLSWQPEYCGEAPFFIDLNGNWFYQESEIKRARMVQLFSSLLRVEKHPEKDEDEYFIVTPVEKLKITVEDVPFIVTQAGFKDGIWQFSNQVGDNCLLTKHIDYQLQSFGDIEKIPYIDFRHGLMARVGRSVYYQLCEVIIEQSTYLSEPQTQSLPNENIMSEDLQTWGIVSDNRFFPLN